MTALMLTLRYPLGRSAQASPISVRDACFATLWLFIAFVSVWDSYLTLSLRHQMRLAELNPIGRALIEFNAGDIHCLLAAKLLGTTLALAWLMMLYEGRRSRGLIIASGVASFQLALLLFLTFA